LYLSCAHFVPGNKGKRLQEGAEKDVLAKAASDRKDQGQLRDKRQDSDQGARRGREGQVNVVEPEREVVAVVLAGHMVEIGLEEELVSVAGRDRERKINWKQTCTVRSSLGRVSFLARGNKV